jgi:hypothetical protein
MPPDRPRGALQHSDEPSLDLPFDADLESLDEELSAAGDQARRMLYGRSQPTRLFSNALRARLLGAAEAPAAAPRPGVALPVAAEFEVGVRPPTVVQGEPSRSRAVPADPGASEVSLRLILAMLTIASMVVLLAVGSLAGTFGPALP